MGFENMNIKLRQNQEKINFINVSYVKVFGVVGWRITYCMLINEKGMKFCTMYMWWHWNVELEQSTEHII